MRWPAPPPFNRICSMCEQPRDFGKGITKKDQPRIRVCMTCDRPQARAES